MRATPCPCTIYLTHARARAYRCPHMPSGARLLVLHAGMHGRGKPQPPGRAIFGQGRREVVAAASACALLGSCACAGPSLNQKRRARDSLAFLTRACATCVLPLPCRSPTEPIPADARNTR